MQMVKRLIRPLHLLRFATSVFLAWPASLLGAEVNKLPEAKEVSAVDESAQNFCASLTTSINQLGLSSAKAATTNLVDRIRSGNIAEYLTLSELGQNSTPLKLLTDQYVPLASLLRESMEIKSPLPSVLVLNASDLRFLPYVQEGTQLIIVTNNDEILDQTRTQAVAATAKRLKISVNVIWYGAPVANSLENAPVNALAYISQASGGKFVNLGGSLNPCEVKG